MKLVRFWWFWEKFHWFWRFFLIRTSWNDGQATTRLSERARSPTRKAAHEMLKHKFYPKRTKLGFCIDSTPFFSKIFGINETKCALATGLDNKATLDPNAPPPTLMTNTGAKGVKHGWIIIPILQNRFFFDDFWFKTITITTIASIFPNVFKKSTDFANFKINFGHVHFGSSVSIQRT